MFSRWFGGGKKQTPEEKYANELEGLKNLGWTNTSRNIELLEMYKGNVDLVIQQLEIENPPAPSSAQSSSAAATSAAAPATSAAAAPAPTKKPPVPEPVAKAAEAIGSAVSSALPPGSKAGKPSGSSSSAASGSAVKSEAQTTTQTVRMDDASLFGDMGGDDANEPAQVAPVKPTQEAPPSSSSAATIPEDDSKSTLSASTTTSTRVGSDGGGLPPKTIIKFTQNLVGLRSQQLRKLFLSIGERELGEMVYSANIDGSSIYQFELVQSKLVSFKKNGPGLPDQSGYAALLKQIEDLHAKQSSAVPSESVSQSGPDYAALVSEVAAASSSSSVQSSKPSLQQMTANEVRKTVLALPVDGASDGGRFVRELADRLYSRSIGGAKLDTLDYSGVLWVSGISQSTLTAERWQMVVDQLGLAQSKPFNEEAMKKVASLQQSVLLQKSEVEKPEEEKYPASNKEPVQSDATASVNEAEVSAKLDENLKQIQKIQDELDQMNLPPRLLKLKQQQIDTVDKLSSMFTSSVFGTADAANAALNEALEQANQDSLQDLVDYKNGKSVTGLSLIESAATVGGSVKSANDQSFGLSDAAALNSRFDKIISDLNSTLLEVQQFAKANQIPLTV